MPNRLDRGAGAEVTVSTALGHAAPAEGVPGERAPREGAPRERGPGETEPGQPALAESYARLGAVTDGMRVRLGSPSGDDGSSDYGWVTGEQLARDPGRLRCLVDAEVAHARDRLGLHPRRDVAATWVFQHYLWAVGALMSWPMMVGRRAPVLGPGDVALRMPFEGTIEAVVAPVEFDCVTDDVAAAAPGARVRDEMPELRQAARETAAAHFAPLMAAFAPELRRGPWALWGMATDQLVSGLWYLGRLLGDEEWGAGEAQALLPGDTPPFAGGAGVRHVDGGDGSDVPTRTRLSCCLLYTVAPDAVCSTCPRVRDDRRPQGVSAAGGTGGAAGSTGGTAECAQ